MVWLTGLQISKTLVESREIQNANFQKMDDNLGGGVGWGGVGWGGVGWGGVGWGRKIKWAKLVQAEAYKTDGIALLLLCLFQNPFEYLSDRAKIQIKMMLLIF